MAWVLLHLVVQPDSCGLELVGEGYLKDRSHKIAPVIRILDAREKPLIFPLGGEPLKL